MPNPKLYIQDYCRLKNNSFFHRENLLCEVAPNINLKSFAKTCYSKLGMDYPKFHKMDGLCKLGILASEVLFMNNEVPGNTALVFANNASSLETDEKHQRNMDSLPSPGVFVYTLPNIVIGEISIRHKLKSENVFFVSEEFDASLLAEYSQILIQTQKAEKVICGWIDLHNQGFDVFLCLVSPVDFGEEYFFNHRNLQEIYLK